MKLEELIKSDRGVRHESDEAGDNAQTRVHDLEMILNVVRKINSSLELSQVLEHVTDEAIRIVKADRGFLMLTNEAGELAYVIGRNARGESLQAENIQVSSSVLEDVYKTGESICIESALTDQRFESRKSILNLALQTIICSLLKTQEEKIGVLYVDSKHIQSVDKGEILSLFEILVGQAAIAIRNAQLYANLKEAYEDLRQAHMHIIQSERMAMKGELASEVSHELKNLVSVVLLSLQRLRMRIGSVTPDELSGIIENAIGGVRKIEKFSTNLLSRPHSAVNLAARCLNKITSDFADFMRFIPKFRSNKISCSLAENVPLLNLDIDQIQQVLLNLVNNIVEARADADIRFATEVNLTNRVAILKVEDSGPGIDESIRPKLFAEKVTTKVDGHGYGLLVCRQIVENHGGSISVDSRKGEGTTFTLTFPLPD
ncbi:MAG: GAF domain-containing protein [Bacteroidetes bacterium]|nr:GAF domain-containing protein [Bacteroidota bacterium]MCW5894360.1 GAF domain-containing protein [Bacteroidota bacterium]